MEFSVESSYLLENLPGFCEVSFFKTSKKPFSRILLRILLQDTAKTPSSEFCLESFSRNCSPGFYYKSFEECAENLSGFWLLSFRTLFGNISRNPSRYLWESFSRLLKVILLLNRMEYGMLFPDYDKNTFRILLGTILMRILIHGFRTGSHFVTPNIWFCFMIISALCSRDSTPLS